MKKITSILTGVALCILVAVPAFADSCYGEFCSDGYASSGANGWANNSNQTEKYRYDANDFGFSSQNYSAGRASAYGDAQVVVKNENTFMDTRQQSGTRGEAFFTSATNNDFVLTGRSNDWPRDFAPASRSNDRPRDFVNAFVDLNHTAYADAKFSPHGFTSSLGAMSDATFQGSDRTGVTASQNTYDTLETNHLNGGSATSIFTEVGINTRKGSPAER